MEFGLRFGQTTCQAEVLANYVMMDTW
ncbi:hypothetical protein AG1IA_10410 [Rhizoctonia solani AG-1 IA]|uniref:Uncharacterized protein n=1 Tax=Thanatephorus cucumeris (strain AG1-IA) TaxID=983506 RepID=L8WC68_THACA|nr:hypothetical protein AG1IA_10410 [Rhizoctonia solani AG-1 IA]